MKILVVDDDPVSRLVLEGALRQFGHTVRAASDGQQAWEALLAEPPEVLIADWMMPNMDGLELCRRVRDTSVGRYVYAILLTSRTDKADRLEGLSAGADDFLTKPLDRGELGARLSVAERILRMEAELREANAELAEARRHELEIGSQIQDALLAGPTPPRTDQWDIAARSLSSKSIDGDFYDFLVHRPHIVDVIVGDAMGKGVPAALMGAGAKNTLFRSVSELLAREGLPSPVEIVQRMNDRVASQLMRIDAFVTMAYARFDTEAMELTLVDCGHTKIIHRRADGTVDEIAGAGNFPVGFVASETYHAITVPFIPGDTFVFTSDGVTESANVDGEQFGERRLGALINEAPAADLVDRVVSEVAAFTGGTTLADDLTVVIVRLRPDAVWCRRIPSELAGLGVIRDQVEKMGPGAGLDGDQIAALQLAVHEAATNIVRHAHSEESGNYIDVFLDARKGLDIELVYEGPPYQPPEEVEPDLDNLVGHGLGLFLIEQGVDRVVYGQTPDGRNRIFMCKAP